jgi:hypothetical protein
MCLFLSPDSFRADVRTLEWVPMSERGLDALMWRHNRIRGALIRQVRLCNIDQYRVATIKTDPLPREASLFKGPPSIKTPDAAGGCAGGLLPALSIGGGGAT